ncbi:hypothetical protein V7S76_00755 [Aquirufa sp. ROCK2-A2]
MKKLPFNLETCSLTELNPIDYLETNGGSMQDITKRSFWEKLITILIIASVILL